VKYLRVVDHGLEEEIHTREMQAEPSPVVGD